MTDDPDNPPLRDDARLGSWKERCLQKASEHRAKWEAKIPTVIARDVKVFRAEDTPDEVIEALEAELGLMALEALAAQADAGEGTDVTDWSREELIAWLMKPR